MAGPDPIGGPDPVGGADLVGRPDRVGGPDPVGSSDLVGRLRAAGCVFAEEEAALLTAAASGPELATLVTRRVAGEPLEHVLGWAAFCGLRIRVGPGVFVPRPRSALLVDRCRAALARRPGPAVLVDLCCGAGAIGLAVAAGPDAATGPAELWATDIDPAAVAWATVNLAGIGTALTGDLFDPLPGRLRGRVDLAVASAPYVPTRAIGLLPSEARDWEPAVALDGGDDGLDVYRRILAAAPDWLAPDGVLGLECAVGQAAALAGLLRTAGWVADVATDEDDRVAVLGTR